MTGREFRLKRINDGLSIRALAKEIEVPEQTIRRFEADKTISLSNAKKVADYFGMTVLELLPELEHAA